MSDVKDEQALEDYLRGDSDLSRRYRAQADAMPAARLDAVVMATAREAGGDKKTTRRWYVPLSLAAVIVISISVVLKIYNEGAQPVRGIEAELKSEAAVDRMDNETGGLSRQRRADETSEIESDIPESLNVTSPKAQRSTAAPVLSEERRIIDKTDAGTYRKAPDDRAKPAQAPESPVVPAESPAKSFSSEFEVHDSAVAPGDIGKLTPAQWLELIQRLWSEGDKNNARAELEKFLVTWPDYPPDQLKDKLPEDMELPVITLED